MAAVAFRDVRKKYGELEVIHGVSTEVADGEFVVIVGPSGCGKSTLLRMVAGLEPITSGEIRIGERVVNDLEPKDRDIAMVFQNYALYPHMTVAENMSFGLRLKHYPKAAWINPRDTHYWGFTASLKLMKQIMSDRMYPLTLDGLDEALKALRRPH